MAESTTPLVVALHALQSARLSVLTLSEQLALKKEGFEIANRDLIEKVKELRIAELTADSVVRTLALEEYGRTKEKKPTFGVEIKSKTVYTYAPELAFAWAQEKKLALVPEQLDVKAFEKIITVTALPFVTMTQEPVVQLATDLGKALAKALSETPIESVANATGTANVAASIESKPAVAVADDDNIPF